MSRTAASGRFNVINAGEDGGSTWVHRWMGDGFVHDLESSYRCLCKPYYAHPDDKRSLDEIADDMEDERSNFS